MEGKVDHKEALIGYSNQLEVEKLAGETLLSLNQQVQMTADQGYAMRLVVAHGFLGLIEAIDNLRLSNPNRLVS